MKNTIKSFLNYPTYIKSLSSTKLSYKLFALMISIPILTTIIAIIINLSENLEILKILFTSINISSAILNIITMLVIFLVIILIFLGIVFGILKLLKSKITFISLVNITLYTFAINNILIGSFFIMVSVLAITTNIAEYTNIETTLESFQSILKIIPVIIYFHAIVITHKMLTNNTKTSK